MPVTQRDVMEDTGLRHDEVVKLVRRGVINYNNDIILIRRAIIRFCMSTKIKALGSEEFDPIQERARKDKELADKTALQNALMRQEIVTKSFFHRFMTEAFSRCREKMLSIPSKMAPIVIHLDSIPEAKAKLTDAVHDALNELAATDVAVDGSLADAGGEDLSESDVDGLESPPEVERKRVGRPRKAIEQGSERRARTMGHEPG